MTTSARGTIEVDPFTVEIVKESLLAVSDEMFAVMQSTAKSPIIYEALDFACGLTDAEGQLITQGNGLTGFLGTLTAAVSAVREATVDDPLVPGDVFITNDPYNGGGGTHQNDVVVVQPLFRAERLLGFAVCKAHWIDVGGMVPGSLCIHAVESFQEGLLLPCVRLYRAGTPVQDMHELITLNVRLPDAVIGDMNAQRACLSIAQRRIEELCDRYGEDIIVSSLQVLLDHGEQLTRIELAKLPRGEFEAVDYIDDDGLGNGPFRVQVKVTITEDEFVCDFTGTVAQVAGPINLPPIALESSARMMFKALTGPHIDANEGCFRPLRVVCPDGTVFSSARPAPVSIYFEAQMHAADVIWKALAPVMPDRLTAGHFLSPNVIIMSGTHPGLGDEPYLLGEPQAGGWGAGLTKDGESALVSAGNGETHVMSVELTEARYGVRIDRYGLHDAVDAGAGEHRGGLGVIKEYVLLSDGDLTSTLGRHTTSPWGVDGGREGSPNLIRIDHADGRSEEIGMIQSLPLAAGSRVTVMTGHGGGWGDPLRRPVERVVEDVREGYVSVDQAERDYGVRLDPESLAVLALPGR